MINLEINKKYLLKLGCAEPVDSIYLGRKRSRGKCKHVFLAYTLAYRTYMDFRFYIGSARDTSFEKGIVKIKNPTYNWINPLEKKLIESFLDKLKNSEKKQ
jgi:hypothetical protein